MPESSVVPFDGAALAGGMEPDWSSLKTEDIVRDIKLDPDKEARIKGFLNRELKRSFDHYRGKMTELAEFRRQYNETRKPKDFPWPGASNIEVPITAPHIDQIVARNMRVLRSANPPIMLVPMPGISREYADPNTIRGIEDWVSANMFYDPGFFEKMHLWAKESAMLGVGIAKVYWSRDVRTARKYSYFMADDGRMVPTVSNDEIVDFEGSKILPIRLEDFLIPPEASDCADAIDTAQWVCQRYRERWGVVSAKIDAGIYRDEAMEMFGEHDQMKVDADSPYVDRSLHRKTSIVDGPGDESGNELVLYEFHVNYDLENDGIEVPCVFQYSYKHDVILSARYAPYFHAKRPFIDLPYCENGGFYRKGICEQLKHTQHAANDVMNAYIDSLTLANTGVWKVSRTAGLKSGKNDGIWAGRILAMDDPDSLQRLDTGQPSQQTMDVVGKIERFAQQADGVGDGLLAAETGRDRETAQGMAQRVGGSTPMFDTILDGIRRALARVAEMYICNFQQFAPWGSQYTKMATNGQEIDAFFALPRESVIGKYRFRILASSIAANPEMRKTSFQHLAGTIGPIYEDIFNTLRIMSESVTPDYALPLLKDSFRVKLDVARQIVQAFELPGTEELIPTFEKVWEQVEQPLLEARDAAKKGPKPLDETLARALIGRIKGLLIDEETELLQRLGFEARKRSSIAKSQGGQEESPSMGLPPGF